MPQIWIDGKLQDATTSEFAAQLRIFANYADTEFSVRSDPIAHLGERLNAAAAEIERLMTINT